MCAAEASQVMLAQKWDEESTDPTGYWMSEKLDGIRAYFTGKHFYSRSGNQFNAPAFFTEEFPNIVLDGELWAGRGLFQKTTSIVKKTKNPVDEEWRDLKFVVFDAPKVKGNFEQRMQYLKTNVPADATHIAVLAVKKCTGLKHLKDTLKEVLEAGGEGLMLRQAGSFYERGRSDTLLKVKIFHDEEAKVVGYRKGNTNPKHRHLECELPNGVQFTLGNGFSEYEHTHPPPIGSVITFQYQEVTNNGVPRFPSFVRVREDVTWDEVLNNYNDDSKAKHIKRSAADCNKAPILFSRIKAINVEDVLSITPKGKKSPATSPTKKNDTSANKSNGAANIGSKGNTGLVPCKYGAGCYQKNPAHFKQYSHPHINNNNGNNNEDNEDEKADLDPDADVKGHDNLSEDDEVVNNKKEDKMEVEEDGNDNNNDNDEEDKMDQDDEESDLPPPCKYGANCYRKNPEHLKEFSHPPKPGTQTAPKTATATLPKKATSTAPAKSAAQPVKKSTIQANNSDNENNTSDHEQDKKSSAAKVPQKKSQPTATKPVPVSSKPATIADEKKNPTANNKNNTTASTKVAPKSNFNSTSSASGSSDGVKRRALPDWAQTSLSEYQKKYLKSSTDDL